MTIPTETLNHWSFERRMRRLHRLGPRPIGELLLELAELSGRRTWLDQRLAAYADLSPESIAAVGAADWPEPPLHAVGAAA